MSDVSQSSRASALHSIPMPPRLAVGAIGAGMARLSAHDITKLSKTREYRWRPGLVDQPRQSEIFAGTSDASGVGLALALARDALQVLKKEAEGDPLAEVQDHRQVLWVQDVGVVRRTGRPYRHGLPPELRDRLIHVEAKTPEDALFALEEGLKCRDLAFVIGEIVGNPRALDFTASRRLSLTAEKHGVPLWLVRLDAAPDLSSARMRWRVEAVPSMQPRWDPNAPDNPVWRAELFRSRTHAPGEWMLSNETGRLCARRSAEHKAADTPDIGDLARPTVGRSLAAL